MTRLLQRLCIALAAACATAMLAAATPAVAQTGSQPDRVSIEALKGRLSDAQARQDLEPGIKTQVVEAYQGAIAALESAGSLRAEVEDLKKTQSEAQDRIQRLESEVRAVRAESGASPGFAGIEKLPLDALERLENRTRVEADQARVKVAELQRRFDDIVARPLSARLEQAELREAGARRDVQAKDTRSTTVPAPLAAAQRGLANARETLRQARLARVEQEIIAQPALAHIAQLELALGKAQLDLRTADCARCSSNGSGKRSPKPAKKRRARARPTAARSILRARSRRAPWSGAHRPPKRRSR